jgi:hypothetical protein
MSFIRASNVFEPPVVMATIPVLAEDPDPGDSAAWAPAHFGDPARRARPGPLGYDPFADTHDARMPRDEGDE